MAATSAAPAIAEVTTDLAKPSPSWSVPFHCSARPSQWQGPGPTMGSVEVLDPRPQLRHRLAQAAGDPDGPLVLVRHAEPAGGGGGLLHPLEQPAPPLVVAADDDGHATVPAAGPPEPVVVVTADRRGQALPAAQEVDGAGHAIVGREDTGSGGLFRRELPVDVRDRRHDRVPAVHVGVELAQLA